MARTPRPPKPPMKGLRVKRGPARDDPRSWYWRLRVVHEGRKVDASFWARVEDVRAHVVEELDRAMQAPVGGRPARPGTVRELLRLWGREQDERPLRERDAPRRRANAVRPRSLAAYRSTVKRLAACIGDVALDRVGVTTLERYRDESGWAPRTVANDLHLLSTIWRWGYEREHVDRAVLPRLTVWRRSDRVPPHTPSPGDVAATLEHLDGWDWLRLRLLAALGCRVGELATLNWSAVDLEGGWIRVSEKTGARQVPVLDEALLDALRAYAIVRALVDPRPEVLGVKDVTARGQMVGERMHAAARAAGVHPFTPHGIRRMVVTQAHMAGMPPAVITSLFGHGVGVSLGDYYTPSLDALRERAAEARIGRLPAGRVMPFRAGAGGGEDG